MINNNFIGRVSTKTTYKRGVSYYNNKSNMQSVVYGDVDPYDAVFNGHGRCVRFVFADNADDSPHVTNIYGDGTLQCNCSNYKVCVHIVAAALHVHDNLKDILAQKPVSLPSLRREEEEMEDRAEAADDLRPRDLAAEFAVWLREEKFDKVRAIRRLKDEIRFMSSKLGRVVRRKKPKARIAASKAVLDLYLDYLYTIMLEHANTRQKRLAYLKFLMAGYRDTIGANVDEVVDSYRKSLIRLYKIDSEWRKYITSSLKSRLLGDDDDGYGFECTIFAADVLPYTGMLEAAGEDASWVFETYYERSATICHEYAQYLERINNTGKAKQVRMYCRKRFGKKTREPQDCHY